MDNLTQAKELLRRTDAALIKMNRFDEFKKQLTEDEVMFRYEAVVGILIMARNDINEMVRMWSS